MPIKNQTKNPGETKTKCARYPVNQLIVISAFAKTFNSGKGGFFGQVQDPATGKKFQIIGAVELTPKS
jgi:hypothetical protein